MFLLNVCFFSKYKLYIYSYNKTELIILCTSLPTLKENIANIIYVIIKSTSSHLFLIFVSFKFYTSILSPISVPDVPNNL